MSKKKNPPITKDQLVAALVKANGNRAKAAVTLKVTREGVRWLMRKYMIELKTIVLDSAKYS